jgi:hypothetical protein
MNDYSKLKGWDLYHFKKALILEKQAAQVLDKVKHHSPKAAKLTLDANKQRQKAGLISGKLKE